MSQILTFNLKDDLYGINVFNVSEILDVPPITRVPGTPKALKGAINIRGAVVPVLDLNMEFSSEFTEITKDSGIIIAEVNMDDELIMIGLLVDAVKEVVILEEDNLEPPPKMKMFDNAGFIKGMGKKGDQFIIILDADKLLSLENLREGEKKI